MTSNIRPGSGELRDVLLEHFKPEFINRLDDIIEFESLSREQLGEIVGLQTQRVIDRMAERGIELTITDEARTLLGNLGYDPVYGARPLKRVIQKKLVDRLAMALLEGELHEGDAITADVADGELVLRTRHGAAREPQLV
jgi:ATP-dependent Clp protease ATP-binding subunit ClpB